MLNKKIKEQLVSDSLYDERIEVCKNCPQVRNSKGVGLTCGVFLLPNYVKGGKTCGCKLEWKARLKNSNCPQEKW
jgi:hypothetical protein